MASIPQVEPTANVAPSAKKPVRILIPFNASGCLYGMERSVIELFDFLHPRVAPHFLMSHTMFRENLPVSAEVRRRGLFGYRQDVLRFLRRAYVYIHPTPPSRFLESFGRSALEAMACGVPAICFRAGAIEEVVAHGETGLICERGSAGCLAENLRRFLDDRHFRDRCAVNALRRYQTVYSPQQVADRWETLLNWKPAGQRA